MVKVRVYDKYGREKKVTKTRTKDGKTYWKVERSSKSRSSQSPQSPAKSPGSEKENHQFQNLSSIVLSAEEKKELGRRAEKMTLDWLDIPYQRISDIPDPALRERVRQIAKNSPYSYQNLLKKALEEKDVKKLGALTTVSERRALLAAAPERNRLIEQQRKAAEEASKRAVYQTSRTQLVGGYTDYRTGKEIALVQDAATGQTKEMEIIQNQGNVFSLRERYAGPKAAAQGLGQTIRPSYVLNPDGAFTQVSGPSFAANTQAGRALKRITTDTMPIRKAAKEVDSLGKKFYRSAKSQIPVVGGVVGKVGEVSASVGGGLLEFGADVIDTSRLAGAATGLAIAGKGQEAQKVIFESPEFKTRATRAATGVVLWEVGGAVLGKVGSVVGRASSPTVSGAVLGGATFGAIDFYKNHNVGQAVEAAVGGAVVGAAAVKLSQRKLPNQEHKIDFSKKLDAEVTANVEKIFRDSQIKNPSFLEQVKNKAYDVYMKTRIKMKYGSYTKGNDIITAVESKAQPVKFRTRASPEGIKYKEVVPFKPVEKVVQVISVKNPSVVAVPAVVGAAVATSTTRTPAKTTNSFSVAEYWDIPQTTKAQTKAQLKMPSMQEIISEENLKEFSSYERQVLREMQKEATQQVQKQRYAPKFYEPTKLKQQARTIEVVSEKVGEINIEVPQLKIAQTQRFKMKELEEMKTLLPLALPVSLGRTKQNWRGFFKKKTRYTPSIEAVVKGITTTKAPKGFLTGIGVRPVVKAKKKGKKKKRGRKK